MFQFGFSYVGLLYLLMLFLPNIIWTKNQPKDYEQFVKKENKLLQIFERIGEVLVCCFVLIFSDFNVRFDSVWSIWLIVSFVLMLLYEYYWICYFKSEKKMTDFYRSVLSIPVAGATIPVCAFFLLGVYGCNVFLMISTIILGIGHIGIHYQHYKENVEGRKKKMLLIRILGWIAVIAVALIIAVLVVIIGVRNYNYIKSHSITENGVYERTYVNLCGQEQYLHISGKNAENPVIIYLHGGPASPDTLATYAFTKYLTDEYTIICWDQRGCGRTYYKNRKADPDNATASFTQAQKDLDALVNYACERFGKDKVIIMGHSYGTILGSEYVLAHPEKVSDYIGIGQFVSMKKGNQIIYEDAFAAAEQKGENTDKLVLAYETYQKDMSLNNMMKLRTLVAPYYKAERAKNTIWIGLTSPVANLDDFRWQMKGMFDLEGHITLNKQLLDYSFEVDLFEKETDYKMPVTFISGSCDFATPVKCTQKYMDIITAPSKKLIVMEGCGHSAQFDDAEEFSGIVKTVLEK